MKKILFSLSLLAATMCCAGGLKVGYSIKDITPPLGSDMPGYYKVRNLKEVLDPLEIVCVAFSDGKKTAFVMQIDAMAISDQVADMMRKAIMDATGVERDAIILHASHTHDAGPLMIREDLGRTPEDRARSTALSKVYVNMAVTRAADAASEAVKNLKSSELSYARTKAERISFGRRYLMKNGKVRTNPGVKNPDIVKPVGNPPDEEVQVVRIDREGAEPIVIINFQTHPDVVGGEVATADWPGLTRRIFEAATRGVAKCIVINGTQGDVNHVNVMPRPGEERGLHKDFDDVDRGYDHAIHMANVIAGNALAVWMKCAPMEGGEVKCGSIDVRVPSNRPKTQAEIDLAKKYWELHQAGRDSEIPFKGMELTTEVARSGRILRLKDGPDFFDIPLTGIAIGKSLAFGAFPGEPFNDIGKAVKKDSPFKMTILSCLSNGSRGYFPFSDSFKQDGYEAATSPFGPSVADDLIKGQLELMNRLYK
jgi:hypothetical protein